MSRLLALVANALSRQFLGAVLRDVTKLSAWREVISCCMIEMICQNGGLTVVALRTLRAVTAHVAVAISVMLACLLC